MTQVGVERANSSTASSDGLTPLHRAVLQNDANTVRKIVTERELGVDVRTATGTTPLMLAALYGRLNIFLYLLGKKASADKKDSQGNDPMAYVKQKTPSIQSLLREYGITATMSPNRGGRRNIYVMLKAMKHQSKRSYAQGQAAAQDESRTQAQLQTPAHLVQPEQQQPSQGSPGRFVFLRAPGGKQQELVEVRQIAVAKHGNPLRHCTGFIRGSGSNENSSSVFAISGWGIKNDNAARENVLDDAEYIDLVRQVSEVLNFELVGQGYLDSVSIDRTTARPSGFKRADSIQTSQRYPGSPSEQKGAYVACHSEKKLAVYVLTEALSHVLNTKAITINNIMLLKDQINNLTPGLRETTIHLDHELVCPNCAKFLEVLTQKSGLVFRIDSHEWYIPGERSQLRKGPDGQYQPVTQVTRQTGSHKNAEVIDDELGLLDQSHDSSTGLQDDPTQQEDSVMTHSDPVTPMLQTGRRSCATRQLVHRVLSDPEKRGSPVDQEPQYNNDRYAKFFVTPPSRGLQALPTPQSHARVNEMPRTTTSPSPAPRSSALGSENHRNSMSPSLSQEWEVEEIVATEERDGARWYLVKWRGFPDENDTWECESNLINAQEAIKKFMEELRALGSQTGEMATT